MSSSASSGALLRPYVPSLVADWLRDRPEARHRAIDGTLVFADISGFTRLTELLARRGKIGAEEMAELINQMFEQLLSAAYAYGAGLIKYGGDALLLLFDGSAHVERGCRAAADMQAAIRREGRLDTSRGVVRMRMSVGVHTGELQFLLVGSRHRELIVSGEPATILTRMEAIADAGQIVVSHATADALAAGGHPRPTVPKEDGLLLRSAPRTDLRPAPMLALDEELDLGITMCAALRDHISSGAVDSEHRHVTTGFIRFSGADRLLAQEGPDALTEAVAHVVEAAQDAAAANDVTFLSSDIYADGGKLLLLSGAPKTVGDDADRVLRTVRAVLDAGSVLALRGGVNGGRAFAGNYGPHYRRTYSLMGDCVNLAARLMAHAEPGQLLATSATLESARGAFAAIALEPFKVKGKAEPVEAFSVGIADTARRAAAVDAMPLVGRERELELLAAAERDATRGTGRVVEIIGEPGMGKSRLLEELCACTSAAVVSAEGESYAADMPYMPAGRMLRELLEVGHMAPASELAGALTAATRAKAPALEPWLPLIGVIAGLELDPTPEVAQTDIGARRERLHEFTSELLAAILNSPTMLIFNDVHFMDEATVALIERLASDAADRPWLVITTRRPDSESPVASCPGLTEIELTPLGADAAQRLLAAATESSPLPAHKLAALAERAAGNPLFLRELVGRVSERGGVADLPESLEGVIAARIDRLSPPDRRALRSAAVLGMIVDVPVLAAVLDEGGDQADELLIGRLESLGELLEPIDPVHRRFSHQLVRDVAYEGMSYRRRALLHARIAEVLEGIHTPGPDWPIEVLSFHCFHGERFDDAWLYTRQAAERARAQYANADAAELYRRALAAATHVDDLDALLVAEVAEQLGDTCFDLGEFDDAEDALRRAHRLARGAPAVLARLRLKLARLRYACGRHDEALRWVTRARKEIEGLDDPAARAELPRVATRRARIRYQQGRYAEALRSASEAIVLARGVSDLRALAEALELADLIEVALGEAQTTPRTEWSLTIYAELGDLVSQARAHNSLGMRAYFLGQWPSAVRHYAAAEDAYSRAGRRWDAATAAANLAEVSIDQGRLSEAETAITEAMRTWRGVGAGAASEIAFGELQLGRIAALCGRLDEARERFAAARSYHDAAGEPAGVVVVDAYVAEWLALSGEHREALALADDTLHRAAKLDGLSAPAPQLQRARGIALLATDRLHDGELALRDSLDAARQRDARHDIARVLAQMLDAGLASDPVERSAWDSERRSLEVELGLVA